jgi:hypothetical protein
MEFIAVIVDALRGTIAKGRSFIPVCLSKFTTVASGKTADFNRLGIDTEVFFGTVYAGSNALTDLFT